MRRRRTVLVLLVVASLVLGASTALGYLPIWAAVPAPLLGLGYLVAAARASRRSTGTALAPVRADAAEEDRDPSWAGVPFVDVVADWCRTVPGQARRTGEGDVPAGTEASVASTADGEAERVEAARLRSASSPAAEDAGSRAGSWRAVPVPLPTYVTAPRVARTVKTIDLGSTGAWTSGRSAPPPLALPVAGAGAVVGAVQAELGAAVTADGVAPGAAAAVAGTDEDTEAIELPHAASA